VKCLVCGQTELERGNFQEHISGLCSEPHISCPSADIKCPWTGKQNELDKHVATCVFSSLRSKIAPIINENIQLKEQIIKYTTENNELQTENQRQQAEIERFVEQCAQQQTQIAELTNRVNGK
jgi:hypothetical protein